jgi:hypothetical protein
VIPLLGVLVALLAACSSPPPPTGVERIVRKSVRTMQQLEAEGLDAEAVVIAMAIVTVDPQRAEARKVLEAHPPDLFERGLAGANVRLRRRIEPSWFRRAGLYLPDRIMDLFDTLSIDLHFGPGLFVDVHATRAASFVIGGRSVAGVGRYFDHSFGFQSQSQASGFVVYGGEVYVGSRLGFTGVLVGNWVIDGVPSPNDRLYQDFRDYWAIGFATTAVFVGVDSDIHLYQIWDFFAGFVGFDPARDDWATTDALKLGSIDRELIQSLGKVAQSHSALQAYQSWLALDDSTPPAEGPSSPEP